MTQRLGLTQCKRRRVCRAWASRVAVFVLVGVVPAVVAGQQTVPGAPAGVTAFVDLSVIPMDSDYVLPRQTVLVHNGRITALGPTSKVQIPAGATRIDGRGKFLMPGLGDCHAHIGASGSVYGMSLGTDYDLSADNLVALRLLRWLSDGVTTIRNLDYMDQGSQWVVSGKQALQLRARAAAGELRGPRIYTAGQWAPGAYTNFDATFGDAKTLATPNLDSVAIYVAAYKAAGYDFLKIHEETPEVVEAVLAAARQVDLPVVGHMNVPIPQALAGMQSIEHMLGYPDEGSMSDSEISRLAEEIRDAGVWNCVTMQAGGKTRPNLVKALHESGAGLLLGSDYPLGAGVHLELELLVEAGLTPYEALATGTKNFARYLKTLDETGTVAVGKRADLILLDSNPLHDITHITQRSGVMIGGRWFGRGEFEEGILAFPRQWLRAEIGRSKLLLDDRIPEEQRPQFTQHMKNFLTSSDSLATESPKSPEHRRRIEVLTGELGAMRAVLTPEQYPAFDPIVRVWLRVQNRRGYPVAVAGVAGE